MIQVVKGALEVENVARVLWLDIDEEVTAVGDEPRAREIDETNVARVAALHQVDDQVVNRRILLVIFNIVDPLTGEDLDPVTRVLRVERAFAAANEEFRIDFADLIGEEFVEEAHARLSTVESAATRAEGTAFARVLGGFKEGRAPHRLPFEFQEFVFLIRDRVADRVRSDIETEVIVI